MTRFLTPLIFFMLLLVGVAGAQQKYWIYFKDSESNRNDHIIAENIKETDSYVAQLERKGVEPIVISRWLNAISAKLDHEQKKAVAELSFVKNITAIDHKLKVMSWPGNDDRSYVKVLQQIEADTLVDLELTGKGVKVGIIDGGFLNANKEGSLKKLVSEDKIKGYRNFIEPEIKDPYFGNANYSDDHGTEVWRSIGGREAKGLYRGLAVEADYYLARTDQGDREYRGEEDYWVAALEWMHEQGVRLVNSSVGYSTGYDDPKENYTISEVDGKSSAITKAATIAARDKGMLIVIAAGNDGNNRFKIISLPADAEGVLSVGATSLRQWSKTGYSGIGPEHLESIKPEVACFSSSGTSFSAPIITGLVACIWQAYPDLTNKQMIDFLQRSSHLYRAPNNYLGYGVPNVPRLLHLIDEGPIPTDYEVKRASEDFVSLRFKKETNIVVFHKKDERNVIKQKVLRPRKGQVVVQRHENAVRTTVATPTKIVEIYWE